LVEELEGMSVNASVTLKLDLRTQAPTVILGDSAQLYRMVSNLITNAIHYTPMGGTVLAILDRTPDEALIHIQDTGIGIPSSEQNRIFDRFYRVQSDRARTTGGSGLGLAIAQAIAQTHQGRIIVQSELTKGSVFTVRLPLIYTQ
jgi:signal transduction histidine kinase